MALQEVSYARVEEGGTATASYEYDDVTLQVMALLLRGDVNNKSIIAATAGGEIRSDGLKDQPEIRLDLSDEAITLVDDPIEGLILPTGLRLATEVLGAEPAGSARIKNRREQLRPRASIRPRR